MTIAMLVSMYMFVLLLAKLTSHIFHRATCKMQVSPYSSCSSCHMPSSPKLELRANGNCPNISSAVGKRRLRHRVWNCNLFLPFLPFHYHSSLINFASFRHSSVPSVYTSFGFGVVQLPVFGGFAKCHIVLGDVVRPGEVPYHSRRRCNAHVSDKRQDIS